VHVVVAAATSIVNALYRGMVLAELQRLGHRVEIDLDGDGIQSGRVQSADVVHIHRYSEREIRRAAGQLRERGVAIVWDNDDDMTGSPVKSKGAMRAQQEQARAASMIEVADVVTTTSAYLAEQYRGWGASEVQVVENYIPPEYTADRRAGHPHGDVVTIGWIGAGEHYYDLEQLGLRATLQRLLAAHPDVRLATVGVRLGLPADRWRHTALAEYTELATHAASYDVGIAPLVDIPFNRARSNVKLKEYAVMGVPWLASPIGPYAGLGERQGGRLVADDRWYEELERLVVEPRARRKLAKRALKWGDSQRIHRNVRAWEAPLQRAVERAGSRTAAAA
jgi:hypothetical protein